MRYSATNQMINKQYTPCLTQSNKEIASCGVVVFMLFSVCVE